MPIAQTPPPPRTRERGVCAHTASSFNGARSEHSSPQFRHIPQAAALFGEPLYFTVGVQKRRLVILNLLQRGIKGVPQSVPKHFLTIKHGVWIAT